jgi:hypothetical protein
VLLTPLGGQAMGAGIDHPERTAATMKRTTQAKTLGVILGAAVIAVAPLAGA